MNDSNLLINSFKPVKSETLYSCKRKSTLIFNALKASFENPTFESIDLITAKKTGIADIFSPYNLTTHLTYKIYLYLKEKNKDKKEVITRSKILDLLAFSDGYSSWENMHHHLSTTKENQLSFVFKYDKTKDGELNGGCMVYTFYDERSSENYNKELFNPSYKITKRIPVGYSWGGIGSSAVDLAQAILFYIDPSLTKYISTLTKGLLCYLNELCPEFIITKNEILQFIELAKQNPDAILRRSPSVKSISQLEAEGMFANTKIYSMTDSND